MSKSLKVAKRYAEALFLEAEENKKIVNVLKELNLIIKFFDDNPKVYEVLFHPLTSKKMKEEIVKDVTRNCEDEVKSFIKILLKRKRLDIIPSIRDEFLKLKDKKDGILRGKIISIVELKDKEQKKIITILEKILKKKLILNFETHKDILGGLWIKVGNKVIDASIRGSLKELKEKLLSS
jgi:F-type H+-transporting ATPase subunit delta